MQGPVSDGDTARACGGAVARKQGSSVAGRVLGDPDAGLGALDMLQRRARDALFKALDKTLGKIEGNNQPLPQPTDAEVESYDASNGDAMPVFSRTRRGGSSGRYGLVSGLQSGAHA